MPKSKQKKEKSQTYVRCIKRYSVRINQIKWLMLLEILQCYCRQKDYFLGQYGQISNIYACFSFWKIRDSLVDREYLSPFTLQARQWKLALKDALETLDRYWASIVSGWRGSILASPFLSKEEKDYLLTAILTRQNLYCLLTYGAKVKLKQSLPYPNRQRCLRFLRKLLKKTVKNSPRVQLFRSFLCEPETYRVFEHKGRQYIAIMSLHAGVRLIIPLSGQGTISGQIRIVLDFAKQRIEVHHTKESPVKLSPSLREKIGIDLGITEVFTDSDGHRFGKKFGKRLEKYSEEQKDKGKKRNRLYALHKKHKNKANQRKARKIQKHNLGKKKLHRRLFRRRQELARQVNTAFNRFLKEKAPYKVVYENLIHLRGKAKSKKLSRLVSAWIRSIISDRLDFKVSQRGSLLKAVNCAFSSCVCRACGFIARENRKHDTFQCQFCGHTAASDHVAAVEILRRENDPAIFLWTPKDQVYDILLQRFRRRLESGQISLPPSQLTWESVRKVLGDTLVDGVLSKLNVASKDLSTTVPGKTPGPFSTTTGTVGRRDFKSRKRKSTGERNSSPSILSGDNSTGDGPL